MNSSVFIPIFSGRNRIQYQTDVRKYNIHRLLHAR